MDLVVEDFFHFAILAIIEDTFKDGFLDAGAIFEEGLNDSVADLIRYDIKTDEI